MDTYSFSELFAQLNIKYIDNVAKFKLDNSTYKNVGFCALHDRIIKKVEHFGYIDINKFSRIMDITYLFVDDYKKQYGGIIYLNSECDGEYYYNYVAYGRGNIRTILSLFGMMSYYDCVLPFIDAFKLKENIYSIKVNKCEDIWDRINKYDAKMREGVNSRSISFDLCEQTLDDRVDENFDAFNNYLHYAYNVKFNTKEEMMIFLNDKSKNKHGMVTKSKQYKFILGMYKNINKLKSRKIDDAIELDKNQIYSNFNYLINYEPKFNIKHSVEIIENSKKKDEKQVLTVMYELLYLLASNPSTYHYILNSDLLKLFYINIGELNIDMMEYIISRAVKLAKYDSAYNYYNSNPNDRFIIDYELGCMLSKFVSKKINVSSSYFNDFPKYNSNHSKNKECQTYKLHNDFGIYEELSLEEKFNIFTQNRFENYKFDDKIELGGSIVYAITANNQIINSCKARKTPNSYEQYINMCYLVKDYKKKGITIDSADLDIRINEPKYIEFMLKLCDLLIHLIKTDPTTKIYERRINEEDEVVKTQVKISDIIDKIKEFIKIYGSDYENNNIDHTKFTTRFNIESDLYRDIDIYRGTFGSVNDYHLSAVRGSIKFINNKINLYMFPTMLQTLITGVTGDLNFVTSRINHPFNVILKYMQRGLLINMSNSEINALYNYMRQNKLYKKCETVYDVINYNVGMFKADTNNNYRLLQSYMYNANNKNHNYASARFNKLEPYQLHINQLF